MNSARKLAVLLMMVGIAGCKHNVQSAAPPPPPAKVYTPTEIADKAPFPQPPAPGMVEVKPPGSEVAQQPPPPKQKKPAHRRPKPVDSSQAQAAKDTTQPAPASTPTQEASAGQPAGTSPIGQLSSSSESSSILNRHQILDLITNTENGLNGIKRTLSSDEQQTATQIRTFLTKAKKALDQDDLDGANTLVTKARVLLDELTKG
jgi:hypothetical protein